jgi:hypothetical protein
MHPYGSLFTTGIFYFGTTIAWLKGDEIYRTNSNGAGNQVWILENKLN